ncbi:MAG: energy-coupling factor ABC transporter ATP-binding protein, partial [Candidatus Bathyarchaeia archaeon]
MGVINVHHLFIKYYTAQDYALSDVNLSVDEGSLTLITGPSSSGKTTLLYALSGVIPHCVDVESYEGSVEIRGRTVSETPFPELVSEIGILLQNPTAQIFGMTVEEDVVFGLENLCLERGEMNRILEETLELVGLKEHRFDDPNSLSGGERQRTVIGSILAMNPKILFLDEPTSNLDPLGAKEVLRTLYRLKGMGKTIILVERKIEHIAPFVDDIIAVDQGRVVFQGAPREFYSDPERIRSLGVNAPQVVLLAHRLRERGISLEDIP